MCHNVQENDCKNFKLGLSLEHMESCKCEAEAEMSKVKVAKRSEVKVTGHHVVYVADVLE